jgi:hypothetical protein
MTGATFGPVIVHVKDALSLDVPSLTVAVTL